MTEHSHYAAQVTGSGEVMSTHSIESASAPLETGVETVGLPTLEADPGWAWAPYAPSGDRPWTPVLAAHLYRRAGFGGTWNELKRALELGPQAVIDELVADSLGNPDAVGVMEDALATAARGGNAGTYVAWWLRWLLETRSVLREKMTLFWHNHFAIGATASSDLAVFHHHLEGLRSGALGGVESLLGAQLNDPALYVALGGSENRRSQPNLAFARPWLETFTVGGPMCSEGDVREAARALTGWFVYGGRLRWIEREHDAGEKTLLGQTGPLDRRGLVEILGRHPNTACTVARALWRWLVSETAQPSQGLLVPMVKALQGQEGTRHCVELVLRSNLFFSELAVGQKIKSPVEWLVGLGRGLQSVLPTQAMVEVMGELGQRLDEPPTVRGWAGGSSWIHAMTLALRERMSRAVVQGGAGMGKGIEPGKLVRGWGCADAGESVRCLAAVLIPGGVSTEAERRLSGSPELRVQDDESLRRVVLALMALPEFQLN